MIFMARTLEHVSHSRCGASGSGFLCDYQVLSEASCHAGDPSKSNVFEIEQNDDSDDLMGCCAGEARWASSRVFGSRLARRESSERCAFALASEAHHGARMPERRD
jgi:hypothetical protein